MAVSHKYVRPADTKADGRALWLQLLMVYASLEGALWTMGAVQGALTALTAALVATWSLSEPRFWPDLGVDPRSIRRGWWIVPLAVAVAGLILLAAWRWHTLRPPPDRLSRHLKVPVYLIWALMQQFLVQSFFFLRLERLLRSGRRAVFVTALLFSSAHIPNPVLVPVTLIGGLLLSELFCRYRTIYLLAVAQMLIALSLLISVPATVMRDMRVGIGYVCYGIS
ncbi:MAG TPA: CPBP family intramembrane glutamic endopeptidase [Steroidobacteraceae bacterium]|nr:CPBP family intramembrane glutamic endopeptidase [Steroidobacteraceae bacterium]